MITLLEQMDPEERGIWMRETLHQFVQANLLPDYQTSAIRQDSGMNFAMDLLAMNEALYERLNLMPPYKVNRAMQAPDVETLIGEIV